MIWLVAALAWLALGAAMFIRDARRAPHLEERPRNREPWRLEYREHEILRPRSVRDRLALREREDL